MKPASSLLLTLITSLLFLNSCSSGDSPSGNASPFGKASTGPYLSYTPGVQKGPSLRHYPVGRQGNLTAWLTSDHRLSSGDFLYNPAKSKTRHRIVGIIRASAMKEATKHDGAFLLTNDYSGPIYPLWEGSEGQGLLYGGTNRSWIPVKIDQKPGVNTWVATRSSDPIGPWSSRPIVIGDPATPESIAGAMWYRSNANRNLGGATSTRMLKKWLGRLDFKKFVN